MTRLEDKSFAIPKLLVWEAWRQVKANKGAPGVDEQDLDAFEEDLENNLFKVWNRMSSGTWFPPPVRAVEIPKPHGDGVRMLGVPTIADRVAQTTVAKFLEPLVEPRFHQDSYGYRPGRSPHDALAVTRERCWKYDWAIDLDVQKFFDEVPWDLIIKAVEAVTDCRWVLLYVKRWLEAPLQHPDGTLEQRTRGTPQGSAISPCLANLFMHYAFDAWMAREFPGCPFERFADDAIVHCTTLQSGGARAGQDRRADERGWAHGCIPPRRGSSIARTIIVGVSTSTPRSRSSGTRSVPGERSAAGPASRSSRSCPRSAPKR